MCTSIKGRGSELPLFYVPEGTWIPFLNVPSAGVLCFPLRRSGAQDCGGPFSR